MVESGQPAARSAKWKWWVCGLLLLASMVLYMDRQTLGNVSARLLWEFDLTNEQYGNLAFTLIVYCWPKDKTAD